MGDDPNHRGGSRKWILHAVEDSLRRLDTDYIDLYQIHRPDHETEIGETLSALSDLVRAGKIRAFGSSTFPAGNIVEAQWAAQAQGSHRFLTEQPRYSILTRSIEAAVLPTTQRNGRAHLQPPQQRLALRPRESRLQPPGVNAPVPV
jgi:aryl-alcohol dehydrogenase-like predicted oxidoreductase